MTLLVAFIVAIPIICALLAMLGFQGREHVVGIDLGTSYSVIGVYQKEKVIIIPDEDGNVLTPSAVAFLKGGEVLVGKKAKNHLLNDPQHTIFNAKRFIGKSFNDSNIHQTALEYHFDIAKNKNQSDTEDICFKIDLPGHPACVSPVVIGGHVIQRLLDNAAKYLGHNQITSAVIAVPAEFNRKQRDATIKVFQSVGLKVVRVLDEPTSAAVAYGLHKKPNVKFVLVYDFGGGTLDVSLLYMESGSVQVIGTAGDEHLGGEDFDQLLYLHFEKFVVKKTGTKIKTVSHDHESDEIASTNGFRCDGPGIRAAGEFLKRSLTSQSTTSIDCHMANGNKITLSLTRSEFDSICTKLLERSLFPVQTVLDENLMTVDQIDEVILVGGSSRIQWIRKKLQDMFPGRKLNTEIDPDVAVAYGAARIID